MRELDRRAREEYDLSDLLLMENAGQAVYYMILERTVVKGRRFLVVSGPGNNGGDGFVVARKLHSAGARVRVAVMTDRTTCTGPSASNLLRLEKGGVDLLDRPDPEQLAEDLAWCDVVVDGLLGTGLTRDVEGVFAEIIRLINDASPAVISIDIPSGVEGDNGRIRGAAVRADTTVTFGLPKPGNVLGPGAALGGRLCVSHISFPPALIESAGFRVALNGPVPILRCRDTSHATLRSRGRRGGEGRGSGEKQSPLILQAVDLPGFTGRTPLQIDVDPITPVRGIASELGTPVVVQGHRALIGLPDGRVFINPTGGSVGTVTGRDAIIRQAIHGMRAHGLPPEDAVLSGVFVEGIAANRAVHSGTVTALTAEDIAAQLPDAMRAVFEHDAGATPDDYGIPTVI
jgi:hydroxyethylthiazole kinase-like uncharacterized protein yjeF